MPANPGTGLPLLSSSRFLKRGQELHDKGRPSPYGYQDTPQKPQHLEIIWELLRLSVSESSCAVKATTGETYRHDIHL